MLSKAQQKKIRLLGQKKHREAMGLFIAEGPKVVGDLLRSGFHAREIFAMAVWEGGGLAGAPMPVQVNSRELSGISALSSPNQVLAVFEIPEYQPDLKTMKSKFVLALDDIRDPGNLGAILRIADWFGIKNVLCTETCADLYNPKVVQASMGSLARVRVHYAELEKILGKFGNVYAAVLGGENMYSLRPSPPAVLLIGNESRGVGAGLMKYAQHKISIPGFSAGADSLNAAIATAVLCAEFRRPK